MTDSDIISGLKEENEKLLQELKRKTFKLSGMMRELESRNRILVESNRHLAESINYAQRIQAAIMPPDSYVKANLPESFILYMPKDIVSGDFYFVEREGDIVMFSVVDCTGHGVPGALMSVMGFNCIEQAVNEKKMQKPSEILRLLDTSVTKILRQAGAESGVSDGMDLSFCTLNSDTLEFQYSGAFNPLYILKGTGSCLPKPEDFRWEPSVKDVEIPNWPPKEPIPFEDNLAGFQVKADKFPIGINTDGIADNYTNHKIKLNKGNIAYIFSDGFSDQFGGKKIKKYGYKQLRTFLASIQEKPMPVQKILLEEEILHWMNKGEQIDDILVMGVKV